MMSKVCIQIRDLGRKGGTDVLQEKCYENN